MGCPARLENNSSRQAERPYKESHVRTLSSLARRSPCRMRYFEQTRLTASGALVLAERRRGSNLEYAATTLLVRGVGGVG